MSSALHAYSIYHPDEGTNAPGIRGPGNGSVVIAASFEEALAAWRSAGNSGEPYAINLIGANVLIAGTGGGNA